VPLPRGAQPIHKANMSAVVLLTLVQMRRRD
jgi:hypothetical protein